MGKVAGPWRGCRPSLDLENDNAVGGGTVEFLRAIVKTSIQFVDPLETAFDTILSPLPEKSLLTFLVISPEG